ncbi:MAG: ATP-binding protein [Planctomycetota bacterium]
MSEIRENDAAIDPPRGEGLDEPVLDRVGQHLLESLDALATVYDSARHFAEAVGDSLVEDTLDRCLAAIEASCGAYYVVEDGDLVLQAERADAGTLVRVAALEITAGAARAEFMNDPMSAEHLTDGGRGCGVLCAPVAVRDRVLGVVAIVGGQGRAFSTNDVKLVSAVTSQAAIALSSAIHYRNVEVERAKLRSVIEDNSDGIILLAPDGRTVLCNSVARRLFDIPEGESEGTDFVAKVNGWTFSDGVEVVGDTGRVEELSRGKGADELVLSMRSREVRGVDDRVVGVILTLHDLTEKRREERLKRDFLSIISHKLRTPVTSILGTLMLLEDEAATASERREFMAEAQNRAAELGVLVDRLLYFAELMEGSWSTRGRADLRQLRPEVHAHFVRHYGDRPLTFEWDLQPGANVVRIPGPRLRVLLDNLIDNAIKFSSPDERFVRVASRRDVDGSLVLEVEDRGPGIPTVDRERVFQSFYQREEDFTGTVAGAGMGLAIACEIVRRAGGAIEVRDAAPRGTIISIAFPERRAQERPE